MLYVLLYVIGVIITLFLLKKYMPYEEGDYEIDDVTHIAFPIDKEMHKTNQIAQALFWPFVLGLLITLYPIHLLDHFYDKIPNK